MARDASHANDNGQRCLPSHGLVGGADRLRWIPCGSSCRPGPSGPVVLEATLSFCTAAGPVPRGCGGLGTGFLCPFVEPRFLRNVAPATGRFRTFLLACFVRWLRDQWVRTTALKRGAGVPLLILEEETHAELWSHGDAASPEVSFDRHWARELLSTTLRRLSESWTARPELFAALSESLVSDGRPARSYAEIADRLGMTEGAVKKAAFDLRRDFGRRLRHEVRRTVERDEDVDGELRHLVSLFRDPNAGPVTGAPLDNVR